MKFLFFIIFFLGVLPAGAKETTLATSTCAQERSDAAQKAPTRDEIRKLTLEGVACANECLRIKPQEPRCLYWRAVNRGLLLETGLANPKLHLKELISDFKRASELEPTFDRAGAFRALGTIYLKLPALSLWGEGYSRDLSQAKVYALEALRFDETNPENLKLVGEIAFAEKNFKMAKSNFKNALKWLKKSELPLSIKNEKMTEIERWIRRSELKLKK